MRWRGLLVLSYCRTVVERMEVSKIRGWETSAQFVIGGLGSVVDVISEE